MLLASCAPQPVSRTEGAPCPSPSPPIAPGAAPRAYLGGEFGGDATLLELHPSERTMRIAFVRGRDVFWVTLTVAQTARLEARSRIYTRVGPPGTESGATDIPLRDGSPSVAQGQIVVFGCPPASGDADPAIERGVIARGADADARRWTLRLPIRRALAAGTAITIETAAAVATLDALALTPGERVHVEFVGAPDRYVATLVAVYR